MTQGPNAALDSRPNVLRNQTIPNTLAGLRAPIATARLRAPLGGLLAIVAVSLAVLAIVLGRAG